MLQIPGSAFPMVMQVGLPVYRAALQQGYPENDAGVKTLLALIARTDDSNMIRRGGEERAAAVKQEITDRLPLLRMEAVMAYAAELDRRFIGENLSPGGSADLLAVTRFLDRAAAAFMLQTE